MVVAVEGGCPTPCEKEGGIVRGGIVRGNISRGNVRIPRRDGVISGYVSSGYIFHNAAALIEMVLQRFHINTKLHFRQPTSFEGL